MTELKQYEKGYSPSALQRKYSSSYEQGYELAQDFKRLQEQLKEANEVIADLSEYPPINTSTRELSFALNRYNAKKYLEKWGVK